jgi:hypothetical protein
MAYAEKGVSVSSHAYYVSRAGRKISESYVLLVYDQNFNERVLATFLCLPSEWIGCRT